MQDVWTQKVREIKIDGVFVEIGYVTKTDFVRNLVEFNTAGRIVVDKSYSTSHSGIFAAGGVTDSPSKQIVISAGEGATAAISASKYIQRHYGSIRATEAD